VGDQAGIARRLGRPSPATLEIAGTVGLGAAVTLVVLIVFPDLVMLVLHLIADAIGGATRPG
jgi:hypothetical protein